MPWRQIVAMRHRLVHGYATVTDTIVYATVHDDLPVLVATVRQILTRTPDRGSGTQGMKSSPAVKICGLSTVETLEAALAAGADLVGLVRYAKSPRHVSLELGRTLSKRAEGKARRVLLVVDAATEDLAEAIEALDPDLIQLHGHESPERVAEIRRRFGRPVAKALGIAHAGDLAAVEAYRAVADRVVLDAKPPSADGALPGGNGATFDWRLLSGLDPELDFMLSGGFHPGNVGAAIGATGARAVDVSSGVESAPGRKDPALIAAFVTAARGAWAVQDSKERVA